MRTARSQSLGALLDEPIDLGSWREVVHAEQVRPFGDLAMEGVIALELEVEQSLDVALVGLAPLVVVGHFNEVRVAEDRRDVIEDRPQQRVRCVRALARSVVVQLAEEFQ